MPKTLDFYFDLVSPYSYLAALRVEAIAAKTHATLKWKPVFVVGVFKATGNSAPATVPNKLSYMMKDLNDWAALLGIRRLTLPANFPFVCAQANRVALCLVGSDSLPAYVKHMGHSIWHEGLDPNSAEVMLASLEAAGLDQASRETLFIKAQTQEIKDALRRDSDELVKRSGFGVPTFFAGNEMFVGNDRLEFVERALSA